jgi:hypothetical protein
VKAESLGWCNLAGSVAEIAEFILTNSQRVKNDSQRLNMEGRKENQR